MRKGERRGRLPPTPTPTPALTLTASQLLLADLSPTNLPEYVDKLQKLDIACRHVSRCVELPSHLAELYSLLGHHGVRPADADLAYMHSLRGWGSSLKLKYCGLLEEMRPQKAAYAAQARQAAVDLRKRSIAQRTTRTSGLPTSLPLCSLCLSYPVASNFSPLASPLSLSLLPSRFSPLASPSHVSTLYSRLCPLPSRFSPLASPLSLLPSRLCPLPSPLSRLASPLSLLPSRFSLSPLPSTLSSLP